MSNIYTMNDLKKDGSFLASAGQRISKEVYDYFYDCDEPKQIPAEKVEQVFDKYRIPLHGGYLNGKTVSVNENGESLYRAFGMNQFGDIYTGKCKYFYLGYSTEAKPIQDGTYYLFDCLDGMIGNRLIQPAELYLIMTGKEGTYTEHEMQQIAADYEANLIRYEYADGRKISSTMLFSCGL